MAQRAAQRAQDLAEEASLKAIRITGGVLPDWLLRAAHGAKYRSWLAVGVVKAWLRPLEVQPLERPEAGGAVANAPTEDELRAANKAGKKSRRVNLRVRRKAEASTAPVCGAQRRAGCGILRQAAMPAVAPAFCRHSRFRRFLGEAKAEKGLRCAASLLRQGLKSS